MKKFVFAFFIMVFVNVAFGQRIKYRDLFPMIQQADEEQSLQLIKEYLQVDAEHPNANFMLARIYEKRYKKFDLLTQNDLAIANAQQARLSLNKCKNLIDEREVKRNDEYYISENGTQMSFEQINTYLQSSIELIDKFLTAIPNIYENFTKSVSFYNKAVNKYAAIISSYNSLDDLYMLYDEKLEMDLNELKVYYDSTIYNLDAYLERIKSYPIGYGQRYSLKPITTYRLEGLVATIPFLKNEFIIWNYSDWADQINRVMKQDIITLKTRLIQHDKELTKLLEGKIEEQKQDKNLIDRELVFNLEKYDFQSLPVALLQYKNHLYKVKTREREKVYYDTAKNLEPESQYLFYSDMINYVREADTLITTARLRNTRENQIKHSQYIKEIYKGEKGLDNYIQSNKNAIEGRFDDYVSALRKIILLNKPEIGSREEIFIIHRKMKFPDFVTGIPKDVTTPGYFSTGREENADGSVYLSGFYKKDETSLAIAYIIKHHEGKVLWYKELGSGKEVAEASIPVKITITRQGLAVLLWHPSVSDVKSSLLYLDEAGEPLFEKQFPEVNLFPRDLKYNEAKNHFLLVFRGKNSGNTLDNGTSLVMNLQGNGEEEWQQQYTYTGDYVDIIQMLKGYILVSNATQYHGMDGSTQLGDTPFALMLRLNEQGKIIAANHYSYKNPFTIDYVLRVSDNNLNLLGTDGSDKAIHILADSFVRVIATNLD